MNLAPIAGDNTQYACISETTIPVVGCTGAVSPLCAWCLSEQGIPAGEGSHGICKTHANRLLLQQRARPRRIYPSPSTQVIREGGFA